MRATKICKKKIKIWKFWGRPLFNISEYAFKFQFLLTLMLYFIYYLGEREGERERERERESFMQMNKLYT